MGEVGGPEKLVLALQFDHRGQRTLVWIGGNPDVAMKIKAGLFLERHSASGIAAERRVHPVEPIADPSRASLQQHELEPREFLERAVLHEAGQGLTNRVTGGHVNPEGLPMHMFEGVTSGKSPRRLP